MGSFVGSSASLLKTNVWFDSAGEIRVTDSPSRLCARFLSWRQSAGLSAGFLMRPNLPQARQGHVEGTVLTPDLMIKPSGGEKSAGAGWSASAHWTTVSIFGPYPFNLCAMLCVRGSADNGFCFFATHLHDI